MAVNIHNLIAAISPDIYCDPSVKREVKKIAKEEGYLKAAEKAKPKESSFADLEGLALKNPFNTPGFKDPIEKHSLVYDSFGESLEPIYFWILDTVTQMYGKAEKLVDNFISSPGSAHFAEMGGRATRMQDEAMKIMGLINQLIKSILNIIYDLKEFNLRLQTYDDYKSKDKNIKEAALLSLKQIWLDTVDIKRNTSSIKGFVQQFEYVTLIDAFMAANSLEDANKMDLNDRVKRILQQRIPEFLYWVDESEKELRKRYEIEKIYLKSQVNSVKLYARWVKPYLRAARSLEQSASSTAALVTAFNTTLFELMLLGEGKYNPDDDVARGDLPKVVSSSKKRTYTPVIIVEINFRSAPDRPSQGGYGFRGKVELTFTSYGLNDQELETLREELGKSDLGEMMKFIEGMTDESLAKINEDIDKLLETEKKEQKEKKTEDINPFTALFYSEKKEEKKDEKEKIIRPDNEIEKAIRSQVIIDARRRCRGIYDTYKKSHSMPAF